MDSVPSILQEIVAHKKTELANLQVSPNPPKNTLSFYSALEAEKKSGRLAVIAECKKGSPSAGIIEPNYNAASVAQGYEKAGATAISVLTDSKFFHGSAADLQAVRRAVSLPIIRKDFIIDHRQITEARHWGANAYLLIAAILDPHQLQELLQAGQELGMDPLVEVHTESELEKVMQFDVRILGVNNRNLHDFTTDLNNTVRLRTIFNEAGRFPSADKQSTIFISESAIGSAEDIRIIRPFADGILVGTSLMQKGAAELMPVLRSQGT